MGFRDLSDSLFERLFRKVKENKWDHAFDQLSYQGRMHPDIMKFPSKTFYEGQLRPLPFLKKESRSSASLAIPSELKTLALNRMMFWSSSVREEELLTKTNQDEARKVVHMIKSYQRLWAALGLAWDETSLGVITPFRAQIAQIQKEIWASDIEGAEYINVDTVERYQGSARDIIVMSLCINREDQWGAVSSPNTEGVDRKLNVALTRARKHFVLIGNKRLIQEQVLYRELSKQLVSFTTDE
jgi:DNA replication ATP-dependent helicase Dna2